MTNHHHTEPSASGARPDGRVGAGSTPWSSGGDGLTEDERESLGAIVARYEQDDQGLNEWHWCRECPSRPGMCPCSGRPWLGDEMAAAVERIVAARVDAARAEERERAEQAERDLAPFRNANLIIRACENGEHGPMAVDFDADPRCRSCRLERAEAERDAVAATVERGREALDEARRAVEELLRAVKEERYRYERVHVEADLRYLHDALTRMGSALDAPAPEQPAPGHRAVFSNDGVWCSCGYPSCDIDGYREHVAKVMQHPAGEQAARDA